MIDSSSIRGAPPERREMRQEQSARRFVALHEWLESIPPKRSAMR
jgi:hypothetical protein